MLITREVRFEMFKAQKTPETINKNFRFPKDLIEHMAMLAANDGVSLNNFVIQCCEYAVKCHENSKKETED